MHFSEIVLGKQHFLLHCSMTPRAPRLQEGSCRAARAAEPLGAQTGRAGSSKPKPSCQFITDEAKRQKYAGKLQRAPPQPYHLPEQITTAGIKSFSWPSSEQSSHINTSLCYVCFEREYATEIFRSDFFSTNPVNQDSVGKEIAADISNRAELSPVRTEPDESAETDVSYDFKIALAIFVKVRKESVIVPEC